MSKGKDAQWALNKIVSYGAKISQKNFKNDFSYDSDEDVKKIIIYLFFILGVNNNKYESFFKKIINYKYKNKNCSEYIARLIFLFIVQPVKSVDEINEKKDILISSVDKLNKRARFYDIKSLLKRAIWALYDNKIFLLNSYSEGANHKLPNFGDFSLLNINKKTLFPTKEIKDSMYKLKCYNSFLLSNPTADSTLQNNFMPFTIKIFTSLKDLLNNIINQIYSKTLEQNPSPEQVVEIIYNINTLLYETNFPSNINTIINKCLNLLNNILRLVTDSKENFKNREQQRINSAYSIENYENFIDIILLAIKIANSHLKDAGYTTQIESNYLIEQKENLKSETFQAKLKDKKNYKKAEKKIIEYTKKGFSNVNIEKSFSKSNICNYIAKILEDKELIPMGTKSNIAKQIKNAMSKNNVDVCSANAETIINVLLQTFSEYNINNQIQKEIQKIIKKRDLSKNFNYNHYYVMALNRHGWKKFSNTVTVIDKNGNPKTATITSTPACEWNVYNHLEGGQGVSAYDRKTEHLINMWDTSIQTENGNNLFSIIRHGNTRGKERATKELIFAAAVKQYGLENLINSPEHKIWNVDLSNVQIMSPSYKYIPISQDKNMPFDQIDRLKSLVKKPFDMEIKDKTNTKRIVRLCLNKLLVFNFGVNKQHYMMKGKLIKNSDSVNEESLYLLLGEQIFTANQNLDNNIEIIVGGETKIYLNRLTRAIEEERSTAKKNDLVLKKKKILNLVIQIISIWKDSKGKGHARNPSAIPTRVIALSGLIGYPVSLNCKSGKDRTGYVSAEISNLMLKMESNGGEVPLPYNDVSWDEREQISEMLDTSASLDIAKANTGHEGLKVSYKPIITRTGKVKGNSQSFKS